jgi:phosphohistidine phosphatase SixA
MGVTMLLAVLVACRTPEPAEEPTVPAVETGTPTVAPDLVLYVARHAEKATLPSDDPALTEEGLARAEALAEVLADVPLDGVYSTDFTRTRDTAGPTAGAHGLDLALYDDGASLVADLQTVGGQYLVIGHSNTIGGIVTDAGGDPGEGISEAEYDRLYVVVASGGETITLLLRYGE